MTTIADLFTKYNCTNCQDDIQGIRVHCAECENFDLCLQVSCNKKRLWSFYWFFFATGMGKMGALSLFMYESKREQ